MSQLTSISPAIAKALVLLSSKLEAVAKTKTNPAFKSKYASLDQILESVKPTLAECGLAVLFRQLPQDAGTDVVCVQTVVFHESGEAISGEFIAKTMKNDAQGVGGAITYLKRYGLVAMLALETDDDDDGNSASTQKVASQAPAAVRPPVNQPASPAKPQAAQRTSSLSDI